MYGKVKNLITKFFLNRIQSIDQIKYNDLVFFLRVSMQDLVKHESRVLSKALEDAQNEFKLGYEILNYKFNKIENGPDKIILIPPKYELWLYLFFAIRLVNIGIHVDFLYFGWAKDIINLLEEHKNSSKYDLLSFYDVERYTLAEHHDSFIINFSENINGINSNIPSFSTVIITKNTDIDFALAYILNHAFSFAGLKNSNIKRVIIDISCASVFLDKLSNKIKFGIDRNLSQIKSKSFRDKMQQSVLEAISDGADLFFGDPNTIHEGNPNNVVLTNITPQMSIFQKRLYGPILMILATDFNASNLAFVLSKQPSKGVIIFGNEEDTKMLIPQDKGLYYVFRNSNNQQTIHSFMFENPALEYLFAKLGW